MRGLWYLGCEDSALDAKSCPLLPHCFPNFSSPCRTRLLFTPRPIRCPLYPAACTWTRWSATSCPRWIA